MSGGAQQLDMRNTAITKKGIVMSDSDEWEVVHSQEKIGASIVNSLGSFGPTTDHTVQNKSTGEYREVRTTAYIDTRSVGEKIADGDFKK